MVSRSGLLFLRTVPRYPVILNVIRSEEDCRGTRYSHLVFSQKPFSVLKFSCIRNGIRAGLIGVDRGAYRLQGNALKCKQLTTVLPICNGLLTAD
jgi:hypothetical protein